MTAPLPRYQASDTSPAVERVDADAWIVGSPDRSPRVFLPPYPPREIEPPPSRPDRPTGFGSASGHGHAGRAPIPAPAPLRDQTTTSLPGYRDRPPHTAAHRRPRDVTGFWAGFRRAIVALLVAAVSFGVVYALRVPDPRWSAFRGLTLWSGLTVAVGVLWPRPVQCLCFRKAK